MMEWTVQVLDEKSNIKYQGVVTGSEKQARSLLATFEKKQWKKLNKKEKGTN